MQSPHAGNPLLARELAAAQVLERWHLLALDGAALEARIVLVADRRKNLVQMREGVAQRIERRDAVWCQSRGRKRAAVSVGTIGYVAYLQTSPKL